jgi:hypothetical protein
VHCPRGATALVKAVTVLIQTGRDQVGKSSIGKALVDQRWDKFGPEGPPILDMIGLLGLMLVGFLTLGAYVLSSVELIVEHLVSRDSDCFTLS